MKGELLKLALAVSFAASLAGVASAQPFAITVQQAQTTNTVPPGGTLPVAATAIGEATTVRVTVSYRGSTKANILGVDRSGSNEFSISPITTPISLDSGQSFTTTLTYNPTSGAAAQAVLNVSYNEVGANGSPGTTSQFSVTFNGTTPDLVLSYALPNGNATPIADGGAIQFPSTQVNTTKSTTFIILNRGSGMGIVSSITINGNAFSLAGLQVPPFNLAAGASLQFAVNFSPIDRTTQTGNITITSGTKSYKINLTGTGTSAVYTYTVVSSGGTAAVMAGQSINFPDTNIGDKSPVTLLVKNTGNGPGTITAITISGASFQIADTPFLPLVVNQNDTFTLTVTFAPVTPGKLTGRLKVGDDTFDLAGTGIGAALTYFFNIGGSTTPVLPGGAVQFSPAKVGSSVTAQFTVTNTGNVASNTNTIFLTGLPAFTLSKLPNLPLSLDPGASASFSITFAPTSVGVAQSTLQIGTTSFPVSGSATPPDAVPSFRFGGPSGQLQPLQQPAFTLTLDQPYSNDLFGTLTLSFASAVFANDPTIQFASGGRTVNFVIPAGTTQAVFPNSGNQISIQTGSVAGTITIVPSFSTANGVDLTPGSVPVVSLTVAQAAPQITSISATTTATGFTLQITGYATSRSVTQLQLTVTPASGQNVTNTSVTIPVDSAFQAWYQGSTTFGSVFTATVPFTLSGNSSAGSNLISAIQSVSVVLSNAQGSSPAQSVSLK